MYLNPYVTYVESRYYSGNIATNAEIARTPTAAPHKERSRHAHGLCGFKR